MTRTLCTGGAGFIGSALVRRLAADGHEVVVLDDMSRGRADRLAGTGCRIAYGDVRDAGAVRRAMQGCGRVVHLAAVNGTSTFYAEPRHVLDVALNGIMNVLDACEHTGCGDLLLVSSSEVYQSAPVVPTPETVPLSVPDPLNPRFSYGGGKIASELAALAWQRTGVLDRLVVARPHNIYAQDAGWKHVIPELAVQMARLIGEHPSGPVPFPVQGTGEETRAFCHADDCTDGLSLLLDEGTPGGIYNVGNDEEVTIAHLAGLIGAHYGREVKVIPGVLAKGSPPRRCPDISKIRALGYEPKVPLAQGLGPVLDWYAARPQHAGTRDHAA
jgi:UDP-glucose 4-epimerase